MIRKADNAGEHASDDETEQTSRRAVIRYTICLFAAIIFFTALSIVTHSRENVRMNRLYSQNVTAVQRTELLNQEYDALKKEYNELLILYNDLLDEIGTEVSTND